MNAKQLNNTDVAKPPILFLHGAFATAECWEKFLPIFETSGYECLAPTMMQELRTSDNPPSALADLFLKDLYDECADWAQDLINKHQCKPVIIGHSMGGLLAQKLVENNMASAGVFITSVAPSDCFDEGLQISLAFIQPFMPRLTIPFYKLPDLTFRLGALNKIPAEYQDKLISQLVYESGRVIEDTLNPLMDPHKIGFIESAKINVPTLTIGAQHDRTCLIEMVRRLARKYLKVGGDYKEYPDNAHMIIFEPNAENVAIDIINWLQSSLKCDS